MRLLKFDIQRLCFNARYCIALSVPWFMLVLIYGYYRFRVSQEHLGQKFMLYLDQSYANPDPLFHWLSQMLMGFYLLAVPIQASLLCSLSHQFDRENSGWRLIAHHYNSFLSHLSAFTSIAITFLVNCLVLSVVLSSSGWLLPKLLPHLKFSSPVISSASLFWMCWAPGLGCLPLLALHYWIGHFTKSVSASLSVTFIMVLVTYTLWKHTTLLIPVEMVTQNLKYLEHLTVFHRTPILQPHNQSWYPGIFTLIIFSVLCINRHRR